MGDENGGFMPPADEEYGPADGAFIIAVAEKFGQMPDTIENEMSTYWLNRVAVQLESTAMNEDRLRKSKGGSSSTVQYC